jgi:hypothetical protein
MGTKTQQIERRQQKQHRAKVKGEILGRGQQEREARRLALNLGWGFGGVDRATGAFVFTLPEIR